MGDESGPSDAPSASPRPRLLVQVHEAIRRRSYSARTEEAYVHWIKRYIYFNGKPHPAGLGEAEVTLFLNHLAVERKVAAGTQNQALSALLVLYKEVLRCELSWLDGIQRASTMIYTHVLNKGGRGVQSPLDRAEKPLARYAA